MEEYVKESYDASMEDEVIGLYDKELHLEKLRLSEIRDVREQGIEQGINKRNIDIAKNMLNDGMTLDMIQKYTNLSNKEIMNLK